jgi:hypothetical protein
MFYFRKDIVFPWEIVIGYVNDMWILKTITIKYTVITVIISIIFISIFAASSESLAQNTTTTDSSIAVTKSGQIKSSCELTVPTIQGPFYKEGSPKKKYLLKE